CFRRAPTPSLFPYTTLFRSSTHLVSRHPRRRNRRDGVDGGREVVRGAQVSRLRHSHRHHGAGSSPTGGTFAHGSCAGAAATGARSEEHTSELQSRENLVCRL